MGRTDSSSRRKYSKKKSSKVSSEGYRKKKSRKNKSKKLRHNDDSHSSCSDDESTSSSLNSSASSEGEYTRKRARSRSRNEVKGSKKRNRRRSLSEDSSEDSLPAKKRKRSRKGKKIKKKKKSKRVAYVSSTSSDSGSCSTCKDESDELGSHAGSRGRSREKRKDHRSSAKGKTGNRKNMSKTRRSFSPSSSDELGSHGRSRGRSREKNEDHRDSTKGRIGNRKSRSKTRSSFSPSRSYDSENSEKVTVENNPMRLKSVITVASLENKEETVYDYDDYPSSKSNDSTELVTHNSTDETSIVKEVNSGANLNVSGNIGLEVDDLESILRQKALENLSRFRGGNKAKPPVNVDDTPKISQSVVTQKTHDTVSMTPVSQPVPHRSRFTWRRDPSVTTVKDEKAATYGELHSSESQPAELKLQSANLSSTSRLDNKYVNETSKTNVDQKSSVSVDQKLTVAVETQTPSSASIEEGSSKEQQNEGNDNSQFEKKTMSVMRGGEMVQVSYKVYIPNRAPALARRQLKR